MSYQQDFDKAYNDLIKDERFLQMEAHIAHGCVSVYTHSVRVARLSRHVGRVLPMRMDGRALARGALLHDYYLYDWHNWDGRGHGFSHARTARRNADRDFSLSRKEKVIIESHMWPLNLLHPPTNFEAAVVCVVDKLCSLQETLLERKKKRLH